MPKDSYIDHLRRGDFITLRQHMVDIFDGDHCAAVVMAYFEYATNGELDRFSRQGVKGVPWVTATMASIYEETIRLYSVRALQERILWLTAWGFIAEDQETLGKVKRYLLDIEFTNNCIAKRRVFRSRELVGKITELPAHVKTGNFADEGDVKISTAIGNFADEAAGLDMMVLGDDSRVKEKKEVKKYEEEQADSQLEPNLEPETADNLEPVWKTKKLSRRPRQEKPHDRSDRLRQMRESAASGESARPEIHSPSPAMPNGRVSPEPQMDFPARWNELIPESPVDPTLLAPNPRAYREPVFISRFDEICQMAKALIAAKAYLTLGFLLSTDRMGQYRWQQLLAGQLEWMKPRAVATDKPVKKGITDEQYAALLEKRAAEAAKRREQNVQATAERKD